MKKAFSVSLLVIMIWSISTFATELSSTECAAPCPYSDPAWMALPDTIHMPPEFLLAGSTVRVRRIVVCRHGVFFNFRAEEKGRVETWWISYPVPTVELYEKYISEDATQLELSPVKKQLAAAAAAARKFSDFKDRIKEMLDPRYKENAVIYFDRSHGRTASLGLAIPMTFYWGNEEAEFWPIPDVYFRR